MDAIVVMKQGIWVCLGDADLEFGGEDNQSVDHVLRNRLGCGIMMIQKREGGRERREQAMYLGQVS